MAMQRKVQLLTKSLFLEGRKCQRKLWNQAYESVAPDTSARYRMEQGKLVGERAREVFDGGTHIGSTGEKALADTRKAVDAGAQVLFEPAFLREEALVRVDVLKREDYGWHLIEVKSSSRLKDEMVEDVAFQQFVLQTIDLKRMSVMHLNKDHKPSGDASLFKRVDITQDVRAEAHNVAADASTFIDILQDETPPEPEFTRTCKDCDYQASCWPSLSEHSLFDLPGMHYTWTDRLIDRGVRSARDARSFEKLKPRHHRYLEALESGEPYIDASHIRALLSELTYPIYFFDFETLGPPLPHFGDMRPWEQYPFQYSVHILSEGGMLTHNGYLHDGRGDPRKELTKRLIEDLGEDGSVIAYHASFEKRCLERLRETFPEHVKDLTSVINRLWDQEEVFKWHYVDPAFKGSTSLKAVLPVLAPECSYDALSVGNGTEAQIAYEQMRQSSSEEERAELYKALWEYCKLDTLAMVRIHEVLEAI